jgi:hypothetical protein
MVLMERMHALIIRRYEVTIALSVIVSFALNFTSKVFPCTINCTCALLPVWFISGWRDLAMESDVRWEGRCRVSFARVAIDLVLFSPAEFGDYQFGAYFTFGCW